MANPHPIQVLPEEHHFHPRDAVKAGMKGGLAGGAVGIFAAAVQNSLSKRNVGSWSVLTRHGATIGSFVALGATYKFTTTASGNLRQKDDILNTAIGGFFGGATLGLRAGRMPYVLGFGALFSVVLATFEYTGGTFRGGDPSSKGLEDYERREFQRLNQRRPIEETVAILGEGRGIKPPGYEERRRQRLQEKYGVEINPVKATVE